MCFLAMKPAEVADEETIDRAGTAVNRTAVALRAAAAFVALAVAGTAHAAGLPRDADTDDPADAANVPGDADTEDPPHHVSLFAGTDLTSKRSYSGFIGATLAPIGTLEQTGPRIGLLTSGGVYRYNTTLTDAVTEQDAPVTVKGKYI